jgi:hypothetical protein
MTVVRRTVLLIALTMLIGGPAMAQPVGTFIPAGDMSVPRRWHTATRLQNGKVLVAGCAGTTSAELYDPATRLFTPTGSMTAVRCGHSATPLADGRVLIAGGDASGRRSAEVYDPADGTFRATGDMMGDQIGHTATLLPNGNVLIAGGISSTCCLPAQVNNPELYDAVSGTFRLTGAFAGSGNIYVTGGPAISAAVALPDGRILIAGEPTSELYNPITGTFQLTGAMTTPCWGEWKPGYIGGRTVTLLTSGLVLLTGGGHEDCGRFADAELYDVVTGSFTAIGPMTRRRANHSATLLRDGIVLIAGGENSCNQVPCFGTQASAEVFDPSDRTFTAVADMSARRAAHSATLLNDGTVLIAGGYAFEFYADAQSNCCYSLSSSEVFVGATDGTLVSPDGTMIPAATQIVDTSGAVWTISATGAILRNGVQAAGGWGTQILWKSSTIYVLGTDGNWWQWAGTGWINIGTVPSATGVSPDGAMVPSVSQIIDSSGAVWTIAPDTAILRNGIQAGGGWGTKILWTKSSIYVYGTDGSWWNWTGSGWTNVGSSDPGERP